MNRLSLSAALLAVLLPIHARTLKSPLPATDQQRMTAIPYGQVQAWQANGHLKCLSRFALRNGKEHVVRYQAQHLGLPVEGIHVVLRQGSNLPSLGLSWDPDRLPSAQPALTPDQAGALFRNHHARQGRNPQLQGKPELCFLPRPDGSFALCYAVTLTEGFCFARKGFIDAQGGTLLEERTLIHREDTPGIGNGYHGEPHKLASTRDSETGLFYLADSAVWRPVQQATFDGRTFDGRYIYLASDEDNVWDGDDGQLASVHAYMGQVYDFYYTTFGRHGIDGYNLPIRSIVHTPGDTDNAFWSSAANAMYFLEPGMGGIVTAAGFDVIAHELTHGVTQYTSNLVYANQSGALNEAISDIMATTAEFHFQQAGSGLNRADYFIGEDCSVRGFQAGGFRNLVDPSGDGYPSHLLEYVHLPNTEAGDWGGVHVNATIFGHAYYLLAAGGTHRISQQRVEGIGPEKAGTIYYLAFMGYLTPQSSFLDAGNALIDAADTLYGTDSNESRQTLASMLAIGFTE